MVDNFKLFKDISDEEMLEMYKDILGSKEIGVRPRSLDLYAKKTKRDLPLWNVIPGNKFCDWDFLWRSCNEIF